MSLLLTNFPQKQVGSNFCKWSSVHQQIEFTIQRKDEILTFGKNIAGKFTIKIASPTVPASVIVGQNVLIVYPSFTLTAKILSILGTVITTDSTKTGTYTGGFINFIDAYKNYHIITQVYAVNTSNVNEYVGSLTNRCNPSGVAIVSVNDLLSTKCRFENTFKYNVINKRMNGEGAFFNIRFWAVYNGVAQEKSNSSPTFFWTNSAKQIQEKYGVNMADYTPTIDNNRERAKFQSVFARPTLFVGYPFSLSFIYSDNLVNKQIVRYREHLNRNDVVLSADETIIIGTERNYVNRLMISDAIDPDAKIIRVWLQTEGNVIIYDTMQWTKGYVVETVFTPFVEQLQTKTELR